MDKLALALAVIALGLGGYAQFGPEAEAGEPPATAASVKVLEGRLESLGNELASVRDSLAAETKSREAAQAVAEIK